MLPGVPVADMPGICFMVVVGDEEEEGCAFAVAAPPHAPSVRQTTSEQRAARALNDGDGVEMLCMGTTVPPRPDLLTFSKRSELPVEWRAL